MKYYLAPMEGLTTVIYRNAYHRHFTPMDKYFTPFLVPHTKKDFDAKERREILQNLPGMHVVPQVLTNSSADFILLAKKLEQAGFDEVNLNFGCPSKTVVSKKKGAGFLDDINRLHQFLEESFREISIKISVKTRMGMEFPEEFEDILKVYAEYPLEELIVHARVQKDFYKHPVREEGFAQAFAESRCPVCCNGDLFGSSELDAFQEKFPQADRVMLGRGMLYNPALLDEYCYGKTLTGERLRSFHDEILEGYREVSGGDRNVLFRMKELWSYLIFLWPEESRKKLLKKIKKSEKIDDYQIVMREAFALF